MMMETTNNKHEPNVTEINMVVIAAFSFSQDLKHFYDIKEVNLISYVPNFRVWSY